MIIRDVANPATTGNNATPAGRNRPIPVSQVQPGTEAPPTAVVARSASPAECRQPPSPYQRCQRCDTEESAGAFCSWCQMAAYDLVEHVHPSGGKRGNPACPLGPYLNPSVEANHTPSKQRQLAKARAAWDATHDPGEAEPHIVRRWHHQANPRIAGDAAYLERHPASYGAACLAVAA